MNSSAWREYLASNRLPTIWCPGCGNGIVLAAIARAMADLGLDRRKTAAVSGIGCWGWADDYLAVNAFTGPTAGPGLRHRHKAGKPGAERNCPHGRRRRGHHRRQPPDPRRQAQRGPHGSGGKQLQLRHDRGQYSGTTPGGASPPPLPWATWRTPSTLRPGQSGGAPFVARGSVTEGRRFGGSSGRAWRRRALRSLRPSPSATPTSAGETGSGPRGGLPVAQENTVRADKKTPEDGRFALGVFADRESEDYGSRYLRAAGGES